jgi:hypothetical protein
MNSYGESSSVLGFLLNPYTRASDGLPITGTILFDTNKFKNQVLSGQAGMFRIVCFCVVWLLLVEYIQSWLTVPFCGFISFAEKFILQQLIRTVCFTIFVAIFLQ